MVQKDIGIDQQNNIHVTHNCGVFSIQNFRKSFHIFTYTSLISFFKEARAQLRLKFLSDSLRTSARIRLNKNFSLIPMKKRDLNF